MNKQVLKCEAGILKGKATSKDGLLSLLEDWNWEYPVVVDIRSHKHASPEQNNTQFLWLQDAAEQSTDPEMQTTEYWRGLCKAYCGVPILLRDDEDFREKYNRVIKPMDYETKLELMREPFDFPITRLMNKAQKSEYLDAVHRFLSVDHGINVREVA